jgi:GNAT superfamily N-acetyltransferase
MRPIDYLLSPPVGDAELNRLFSATWIGHTERTFAPVLERSLAYVTATDGDDLVGFVNVAWDGGAHAFLLDPTVAPAYQRRGIGTELVLRAAAAAAQRGAEWLHVDFAPELEPFYERCGFRGTRAGLLYLPTGTRGAALTSVPVC